MPDAVRRTTAPSSSMEYACPRTPSPQPTPIGIHFCNNRSAQNTTESMQTTHGMTCFLRGIIKPLSHEPATSDLGMRACLPACAHGGDYHRQQHEYCAGPDCWREGDRGRHGNPDDRERLQIASQETRGADDLAAGVDRVCGGVVQSAGEEAIEVDDLVCAGAGPE